MRRAVLVLAGLLFAASVPASLAEDNPLSLFLYVTPDTAAVNETVEVHALAFMGGTPADLDTLGGDATPYEGPFEPLSFGWVGPGHYVANWTIPSEADTRGTILFAASGDRGGFFARADVSYVATGHDHPAGILLSAQVFNDVQIGYDPRPGASVIFEVHTAYNGVHEDRGTPDGFVVPCGPRGGCSAEIPLVATTVEPGVFHFSFQVPPNLNVSTKYEFHASMAAHPELNDATTSVTVHPISAVLKLENVSADGVDARVCAGWGTSPLENASVAFSATIYHPPAPSTSWPINTTTAANGCSVAHLDAPGEPRNVSVRATVTAFGLATRLGPESLLHDRRVEQVPRTAPEGTFRIAPAFDPSTVARGAAAAMPFNATQNNTTLANTTLGVIAWYNENGPPGFVGDLATGADGRFTLPPAVPAVPPYFEPLHVLAFTPEGARAEVGVLLGPLPTRMDGYQPSDTLSLDARQTDAGAVLHIESNYLGSVPLGFEEATAYVIPYANETGWYDMTDANLPWTRMSLNGSRFVGDLELPGWLWETDYLVWVSVHGWDTSGAENRSVWLSNATIMHLVPAAQAPFHATDDPAGPATPTTPPPPAPSGGFAELFAGAPTVWLLVALVAVACGVAYWAALRRNRKQPPGQTDDGP